jgi:hypothetical protein
MPSPHGISWTSMKRALIQVPPSRDIDMQHCPNCGGGELKIIVATLERSVIEKLLTLLGLDPQPPPRARARELKQD